MKLTLCAALLLSMVDLARARDLDPVDLDAEVPSTSCRFGFDTANIEDVEVLVPDEHTTGDDDEEDWKLLLDAIRTLETGTREEKLALFDDEDDDPFWALDEPPDDDLRVTEALVERLVRYVERETDDFVLAQMAWILADWSFEEALPVMHRLATHPHPDVRHAAVYQLEDWDEPEERLLARMWKREHVPWLRERIMKALEGTDSAPDPASCLELVMDDELHNALAGQRCVMAAPPEEAMAVLVSATAHGRELFSRASALEALRTVLPRVESAERLSEARKELETLWSRGVPDELRALLLPVLYEAGSSMAVREAARVQPQSDAALGWEVERILLAVGDADTVERTVARARAASLESLAEMLPHLGAGIGNPEVLDLVLEALASEDFRTHRAAAEAVLHSGSGSLGRPLPDALELAGRIERLAEGRPGTWVGPALLSMAAAIRGGGWPQPRPRSSAALFLQEHALEPAGGHTSVRCHSRPGIEADPDRARRLTSGLVLFDRRHATASAEWVLVETEGDEPCWVPAGQVQPSLGHDVRVATFHPDEIDLPLTLTDAPVFVPLLDAGIVELFDRGETLTGAVIHLDPHDELGLALLRAMAFEDTVLGSVLEERLRD